MTDQIYALEEVGFRYHDYGELTDVDGTKYDYFKGDQLTVEQKAKLMEKSGLTVKFFGSSPQYAPEIKHSIVGFAV